MAPFPIRRSAATPTTTYPPSPVLPSSPIAASSPSRIEDRLRPSPLLLCSTFGEVSEPGAGILTLPGQSYASVQVVRECLQDAHINQHTFINERQHHNHTAHHILAVYSLGATAQSCRDTFNFAARETIPMLPIQPLFITESNWRDYLGEERLYPNFLTFFNMLISRVPSTTSAYYGRSSSVVPVLEKYMFDEEGGMLIRSFSGALHPLIHICHGIEFGIDAIVAEGLAQSAVTNDISSIKTLFDRSWPLPRTPATSLQSVIYSALSSLRIADNPRLPISTGESFAFTAARLPRRGPRLPRSGLSGFSILERMMNDAEFAPGVPCDVNDAPRLAKVIRKKGFRIKSWADEWRLGDAAGDDEDEDLANSIAPVPSWEEIVERTEELFWIATVLYAAGSRPGYAHVKFDFFLTHCLTSVLFLPSLLQVISPHLRPAMLHSHFRMMMAYYISAGRPRLFITETLMSVEIADESKGGINPWASIIARACEFSDDCHVAKSIRALVYADTHFGRSPKGLFASSLAGSNEMDGSIFLRAAILTIKSCDQPGASMTRYGPIGFDETWENVPRSPNYAPLRRSSAETIRLPPVRQNTDEYVVNVEADTGSVLQGTGDDARLLDR